MSVSVSMPQLGESVTEGTVTRWLKREGEHVQADEPLLEVSTDKVDTEIPSPVSGILRGITVAEDETVAVGAELAVIEEDGSAGAAPQQEPAHQAPVQQAPVQHEPAQQAPPQEVPAPQQEPAAPAYQQPAAAYEEPAAAYEQPPVPSYQPPPPAEPVTPADPPPAAPAPPAYQSVTAAYPAADDYEGGNGQAPAAAAQFTDAGDGPYVTPLVRKLAAEHGIDLATVTGTGVGGRIRKQDILDAAALQRGPVAPGQPAQAQPAQVQPAAAQPAQAQQAPAQPAPARQPAPAYQAAAAPQAASSPRPATDEPEAGRRPAIVPSSLRGTTERMSRARQVIAQRMVESLQTSAQLTTVVEADVTAIARLRERAKAAFEAREGVKLSFLPFF